MKNHKYGSVALVALLAVSALAAGKIVLRANLLGLGKGKAAWKVDDRPGQLQAQLEVSGENLPKSKAFTVTIGNNVPFSVTTDALGAYKLAQTYVTANRPQIGIGTPVVVKNAAGIVVQAGNMVP